MLFSHEPLKNVFNVLLIYRWWRKGDNIVQSVKYLMGELFPVAI
jgi:hypothetical protein